MRIFTGLTLIVIGLAVIATAVANPFGGHLLVSFAGGWISGIGIFLLTIPLQDKLFDKVYNK